MTDVIEVEGLVKRYGDLVAVDGLDLTVGRGEVFSLLGPNGAGKTTTVEILECIRRATSGRVTVLGMDISRQGEIKSRIGVLPQGFDAFDLLTVRENLLYFAGMFGSRRDVDGLVSLMELEDKRDVLFKDLSGGLKQRVGVAIALVNDPEIVFLDEPSTGLDPKARREVWKVVRDLRDEGRTVILTTHYMEEAEVLSDRVAIMDRGRVIAMGTPREVIERHGGGTVAIVRGGGEEALARLSVNGLEVERGGEDVTVRIRERRELTELVTSLDRGEVPYEEILVKRSTLEDVFLNLTGKRLEVEEDAQ